jgi:hypothetical protein
MTPRPFPMQSSRRKSKAVLHFARHHRHATPTKEQLLADPGIVAAFGATFSSQSPTDDLARERLLVGELLRWAFCSEGDHACLATVNLLFTVIREVTTVYIHTPSVMGAHFSLGFIMRGEGD